MQQVLRTTYLVEHICPGEVRAWHMLLYKPRNGAIVSVIISGVPSSCTFWHPFSRLRESSDKLDVCEIDKLATNLSYQLLVSLTVDSKHPDIEIAENCVLKVLSYSYVIIFNLNSSILTFVKISWSLLE